MTINVNTIQSVMLNVLYDMFLVVNAPHGGRDVRRPLFQPLADGIPCLSRGPDAEVFQDRSLQRVETHVSCVALVELVKNIFKMAIVGVAAWLTVRGELANIPPLMYQGAAGIMDYVEKCHSRSLFRHAGSWSCWLFWTFSIRSGNTPNLSDDQTGVKEENKQQEGDPFVKARIRRIQREIARKRMMAAVPKADVVITNPYHLAVAIRYDPEKMNAPIVVAKGADRML
jgi:flagellar biosynthetic protein FlhB